MRILTAGLAMVALLLSAGRSYGQEALSLNGRLLDKKSGQGIAGAEVVLRANSQAFRSISNEQGNFLITIPIATYTAEITRHNFSTEAIQNVIVNVGDTAITLYTLAACPFSHQISWVPACPQGHSDYLIPIVYGFPGTAMMKKAEAGKIRLGGCVHSECEPTYYCPVHDKEL